MRVKNKSKNKELQEDIAIEEKIKKAMANKKDDNKPELDNFYKLYNNHHAFITGLEFILENQPSRIGEFIFNNWKRVFPTKPFPTKGGTLQILKVCIQYGYVMQAYKKYGIKPTRKFVENYHKALDLDRVDEPIKLSILDRCEKYNKLSQIIIEPETETETETEQRITSVTFNEGETEMAGTRVKKKVKKAKKIVTPKRATKSKPKGESKLTKCLDLLLKRRYDDDDILEKSGLSHKKFVTWYRKQLNDGVFKDKGYSTPRPKVEKIGGVVVSKGKVKRAATKKKKKAAKKKK